LAAHQNQSASLESFRQSWQILGLPSIEFNSKALDNMTELDKAVRRLQRLQPLSKPRLLKACCSAIVNDEQYAPELVELLRAIADTIDVPIPPIVTREHIAA